MNFTISQLERYREHLIDIIAGLRSDTEFRECELEAVLYLIKNLKENEKPQS